MNLFPATWICFCLVCPRSILYLVWPNICLRVISRVRQVRPTICLRVMSGLIFIVCAS